MAGKIFISYRRDDVPGDARGIRDALTRRFGNSQVFMDVDDLLAGQRFDRELEKALVQCDVLIAVLGPRWEALLRAKASSGERDFVHDEIASALERGIVVIPVLVGRQERMPPLPRVDHLPSRIRDLVLYQKHDVTHETFGRDVQDLVVAIRAVRKVQGLSAVGPLRWFSASSAFFGRALAFAEPWLRSRSAIAGKRPSAKYADNPLSQLLVTPQWWSASLCVLALLLLMTIPNFAWQFFPYPSGYVLKPAELTAWPSAISLFLSWLIVLVGSRLFVSSLVDSLSLASAFVAGSMVAVPNAYLVWLLTIPAGVGQDAGAFSSFELSIPFGIAGIVAFLWLNSGVSLRPLIFIGVFAALVVARYYLFVRLSTDGVTHPLFLIGLLAYPYISGFSLRRYSLVCMLGAALCVAWTHFNAMPTILFGHLAPNAQILFGVYIVPIFTVWIALRAASAGVFRVRPTNRLGVVSRLVTIGIVLLVVVTSAVRVAENHFAAPAANEVPLESDVPSGTPQEDSAPAQPPQAPVRR